MGRDAVASGLARLLRLEHTLFSLPFAYIGAMASGFPFNFEDALLMATAVLGLRSASMAFNNIADLDIDRRNPRTMRRPLVTGAVSLRAAWFIVLLGLVVFHVSSFLLNMAAFLLSFPIALLALSYPYAKRLHPVPHLHLGLSLGMVVLGGAVAAAGDEAGGVGGALSAVPWSIVGAVTLWVAGFDIVYSLQDMEFDRRMGLGSIPAWLGERWARRISLLMHIAALILLLSRYYVAVGGKVVSMMGVLFAGMILLGQHLVDDKKAFNLNLAFPFTVMVAELGLFLGN